MTVDYSQDKTSTQNFQSLGTTVSNFGFSASSTYLLPLLVGLRHSGQKDSDWRNKVARHENATTSFDGDAFTARAPYNVLGLTTRWWDGSEQIDFIIDPAWIHLLSINSPYLGDLFAVRNQCLIKFNHRIRSTYEQFAGGVAAGELAETLRMLRNPALSLRRGVDDYLSKLRRERGRVSKKPRQRRKFLRDTWLEYSFGWLPFINDINGAVKALNDYSYNPNEYINVKAVASNHTRSDVIYVDEQARFASHLLTTTRSYQDLTKTSVYMRGQVRMRPNSPLYSELSRFGFNRTAFVPTLWELIPYSFLVDYFTNIGDILNAWSLQAVDIAWHSRTSRVSTTRTTWYGHAGYNDSPPPFWIVKTPYGGPGFSFRTAKKVLRDVPGSLIPSLRFEIPGIASRKWINIAALSKNVRGLTPF